MKRSGFSMIELVFVIVILGVLAAVAVPRFVATRTDAQIASARSDIASTQKAIVAKVFADNIDATASVPTDPNKKVDDPNNEYKVNGQKGTWGDWIIDVAGLDGARWAKGGKPITGQAANPTQDNSIQPIGNVSDKGDGKPGRGGCGAVLGIYTGTQGQTNDQWAGSLVFAPNTIGGTATSKSSGNDFCGGLKKSYESSGGPGNKIIPLASTGTLSF